LVAAVCCTHTCLPAPQKPKRGAKRSAAGTPKAKAGKRGTPKKASTAKKTTKKGGKKAAAEEEEEEVGSEAEEEAASEEEQGGSSKKKQKKAAATPASSKKKAAAGASTKKSKAAAAAAEGAGEEEAAGEVPARQSPLCTPYSVRVKPAAGRCLMMGQQLPAAGIGPSCTTTTSGQRLLCPHCH
jgi:hypothetical protein